MRIGCDWDYYSKGLAMTHVFTRIVSADTIWIKGIRSALCFSGGGRIIKHKRGIDVYVKNSHALLRVIKSRY